MSQKTKIQWCDSTVNPTMGCSGCELFPTPARIIEGINAEVSALSANSEYVGTGSLEPNAIGHTALTIDSRAMLKELINDAYLKIQKPETGHRNAVTTTNIWHLREKLCSVISDKYGNEAGRVALGAIMKSLTCYAAKLHLNRGANIDRPEREIKKGYAPTFEQVTNYEGRMADATRWKDLLGSANPVTPWKDKLPRMVFISDMGDALSSKSQRQFGFLKREVIESVNSVKGRKHLWLWLTKRPLHLRDFAQQVFGLPPNICAMTTLTGLDTLYRVDELRQVRAECRGLSVEPLWERIPPEKLDLRGIDWLIVGGESGSGELTKPFHLEWAEELRDHCRKQGVAFFLKQLGRNPMTGGKPIRLRDPHGGDWNEWPSHLRVREFPEHFHRYRADELKPSAVTRPA